MNVGGRECRGTGKGGGGEKSGVEKRGRGGARYHDDRALIDDTTEFARTTKGHLGLGYASGAACLMHGRCKSIFGLKDTAKQIVPQARRLSNWIMKIPAAAVLSKQL